MWCIRLLNAIGRDTLEYSHLIGIDSKQLYDEQ